MEEPPPSTSHKVVPVIKFVSGLKLKPLRGAPESETKSTVVGDVRRMDCNSMDQLREVAVEAALSAGETLIKKFGRIIHAAFKGERDLVTEADRMSEEVVVSTIRKAFPRHRICAEERGCIGEGEVQDEFEWFIDPLDGTTNFAHGVPIFAVSVGLVSHGTLVLGVVYNPVAKELFVAQSGRGAFLNGIRIGVSKVSDIGRALLATGFPYDMSDRADNNLDNFTRVATRAQGVRRLGVASIDLAYVACGRFDAFWEPGLAPWDVAAGVVLVREAGGAVTDYSGREPLLNSGQIVASNGKVHGSLLQILSIKNSDVAGV